MWMKYMQERTGIRTFRNPISFLSPHIHVQVIHGFALLKGIGVACRKMVVTVNWSRSTWFHYSAYEFISHFWNLKESSVWWYSVSARSFLYSYFLLCFRSATVLFFRFMLAIRFLLVTFPEFWINYEHVWRKNLIMSKWDMTWCVILFDGKIWFQDLLKFHHCTLFGCDTISTCNNKMICFIFLFFIEQIQRRRLAWWGITASVHQRDPSGLFYVIFTPCNHM